MLYTAVLARHSQTGACVVQGVEARVCLAENVTFTLTYLVKGDMTRLRIPPPRSPCSAGGLWQHTCFEVFIAEKGQPSYWEFNFSPSGEWTAYAFKSYRVGGAIENRSLQPEIVVRSAANIIELGAIVRLDRLAAIKLQSPLRMGLSAVIEENDGRLSYWALKHPPGKPDFHHPDAFALSIDPSDMDGGGDSDYTGKR